MASSRRSSPPPLPCGNLVRAASIHHLPAPLRASLERNRQSSGLAEAQRQVTAGRVDGTGHRSRWPIWSVPRETPSSNEAVSGSVGSTGKCCCPLRGVAPPRSAAISMNALAAVIAPSLSIHVEIGTARSVSRALAIVGWKSVAGNFFRPLTCKWSSPCPVIWPVGLAEQEGPLRSPVSYQCGNPSRSGARSETSRCRNRLLQRAAHRESKTRHHAPWVDI